jgi:hypothetical protein
MVRPHSRATMDQGRSLEKQSAEGRASAGACAAVPASGNLADIKTDAAIASLVLGDCAVWIAEVGELLPAA